MFICGVLRQIFIQLKNVYKWLTKFNIEIENSKKYFFKKMFQYGICLKKIDII